MSYTWTHEEYLSSAAIAAPVVHIGSETETFQVITASGTCIPDTSHVTIHVSPGAEVRLPGTVTTTPHAEIPLTIVSGDLTSYTWTA